MKRERTDPAGAIPWGAGSLALHLALAVLLGMTQLVRPVNGNAAPADSREDPAGFVTYQRNPPEFQADVVALLPPWFEMILPPPPPVDSWHREGMREGCIEPTEQRFLTDDDLTPHANGDPFLARGSGRLRIALPAAQTEGGRPGSGAVLAALRWLARHQSPDGTWKVAAYTRQCHTECLPNPGESDFNVGVTALALLAFSRAGCTPVSEEVHDGVVFGAVMRKAISALVSRQDREGCIGNRNASKYLYNHVFATLALAESTRDSMLFRAEVRDAVEFLLDAQNPGRGWRYGWKCGDNDTIVTGWAVHALRAAEPFHEGGRRAAYAGAIAWFDEVTEEAYGRVGYNIRYGSKCFQIPPPAAYDWHEVSTAMAAAARWPLEAGTPPPAAKNSMDLLARDKPQWGSTLIDFMYWYAGTLAFKTVDEGRGKRWEAWKEATIRSIVPNQNARPGECRDGSWEPVDKWSDQGGRVYATAINALTLLLLSR